MLRYLNPNTCLFQLNIFPSRERASIDYNAQTPNFWLLKLLIYELKSMYSNSFHKKEEETNCERNL